MGFYQEYELLGLVHDGPTKTLRAREIASDRAVFLHLLTGALTPDAQKSLLERVEALMGQSSAALKIGEFAGTRYVVTDILEPFTNLELWVKQRMGGPPGPLDTPPSQPSRSEPAGAPPGTAVPGSAAGGSLEAPHGTWDAGIVRAGDTPPASMQPTMQADGPLAEARDAADGAVSSSQSGQVARLTGGEPQGPAATPESASLAETSRSLTTTIAEQPAEESARAGHDTAGATGLAGDAAAATNGESSSEDSSSNGVHPSGAGAETVPPDQALRELTGTLQRPEGEVSGDEIRTYLDQAKQHLENAAVRNALDSLETALQLRPDDPEALRMVHEAKRIERGELADEELQAQKDWYYQRAREQWESGDVQATRDELDRLLALEQERPCPQPGRSAIYHDFQRQVQSESEALSNSYAEARAQMAEENLDAALTICDRYLAKFPNHALFQALRFDIGERRRQEALAYIGDTDRRADAEPDLDRRIQILQQALQRYPGEKHFEEAIGLIREKQQLVRSIVDKASALEQSQRFREALDQWQLMESVHCQLPGLQGNVKRLEQRLQEQRVHQEARGRWVAQSKRCLQAGDYEQALNLVRNALEECPDDSELRQLELEAGQGLQRVDTVRDHLRQAQQLWHAGRRTEGLERLRQAHKLDPRNTLVRGELVNALVELARHQVETDWASAEPLVEEILRLEPNHTVAVHLLEQAGRQKREEIISWCLVEARRLRAQGQLEAAYGLISDHLRQYPEEDRLLQLEVTLAQELDPSLVAEMQSSAGQALDESGDPDAGYDDNFAADYQDQPAAEWDQAAEGYGPEAAVPSADAGLPQDGAPVGPNQAGYSGEDYAPGALDEGEAYGDSAAWQDAYPASGDAPIQDEIDDRAAYSLDPDHADAGNLDDGGLNPAMLPFVGEEAALEDLAETPRSADSGLGWSGPVEEDEDLLSRLASDSATAKSGKPRPNTARPQAAKPSTLHALRQKCTAMIAELRRRLEGKNFTAIGRSWPVMPTLLGVAAGIALLGILGTVLIWKLTRGAPGSPAAAELAVTIQSSPPGAALTVDGKPCPSPCQLGLAAAPHRVQASLAGFHPAAVSFDLTAENAAQPVVVTLLPLTPVLQINSDLDSGELTLDDNPLGELEDGGFDRDLGELGPGEHTLRLAGAGNSAAITFEIPAGGPPTFTAPPSVKSLKGVVIASLAGVAQVYGTETGETVGLDGHPVGKLGGDSLVLEDLSEGTHELTLGTGKQQRKYVFDSGPAPLLAAYLSSERNVGTLRIVTGEDGVKIFLNGTEYRRKTLRGRRLIYLYPKKYEVRVEKEGFRSPPPQTAEIRQGEEIQLSFEMPPLPQTATLRIANGIAGTEVWIDGQSRGVVRGGAFTATLEAGKHTIRLENENYKTTEIEREFGRGTTVDVDGALESAVGTLEIQVNPPDADVSVTLQREGETAPRPVKEKTLQLPPGTYTVHAVAPGFHDYAATVRIAINQTKTASLILRKVEPPKPPQPTVSMADWEKAGWHREKKLLVRHGGDISIAEGSGGAGRYTFTALLEKGRRLEWVVDYIDSDNYVYYQLGKDYLHRTEVSKGKKSRTIKIPHKMKWDDFLSVDIGVTADSIVHRVLVDDKWVELDNWKQPGGHLTEGKFGFRIPGRDQVGLSHFAFVPEH